MHRAAKVALVGAFLWLSPAIRADDELVRVTTSFDARHVSAVLRRCPLFRFGAATPMPRADRSLKATS
jgi:hypothetical protein